MHDQILLTVLVKYGRLKESKYIATTAVQKRFVAKFVDSAKTQIFHQEN